MMNQNFQHNNHFILIENHQLKNLHVEYFHSNLFFIYHLTFIEESPRSPTFHAQYDPNSSKPKWEIRLPQLLNTTVGPDRQVIHTFSIYIYICYMIAVVVFSFI